MEELKQSTVDNAAGSRSAMILETVHELVQSVKEQLELCKVDSEDLPPPLDLGDTGQSTAVVSNRPRCSSHVTASQSTVEQVNMPQHVDIQFMDMIAWNVPNSDPDPGQEITLRKNIPVDLLQVITIIVTDGDM